MFSGWETEIFFFYLACCAIWPKKKVKKEMTIQLIYNIVLVSGIQQSDSTLLPLIPYLLVFTLLV